MNVVSCWYRTVVARNHQAVAAVVTVQGLVVVAGAGVLGPQLDLVQVQFRRAEIALGGVDEIRVERQAVEVPGPVRELLDPGELARGVLGMGWLDRRSTPRASGSAATGPAAPSCSSSGARKSLDEGEPPLADLVESGIRHPHSSAQYASRRHAAALAARSGALRTRTLPRVRAVQFDMADADFPASLVDLPEPELPGAAWARVAVTTGGICGSDLHLFSHNTGPSPTLVSMGSFPFVLGHEIAGRVIEAGPECPLPLGTRVAVDPCLPCAARGIDPPCPNCARGWTSSCLNLDSRVVTGGRSLGFTQGLGGGWGEQVLAHASMLHPIPDAVPDRGASLYEPVSIACHGLLRAAPDDGDPVLVVGAGVLGLAIVAALKGLFPRCPVTVLARHAHQAEAAAACGADHVVRSDAKGAHFEELARLTGCAGRGPQGRRHAHGRLPLRRRGRRGAAVGHRGAACRRPPGHRPPARRGRCQRGRPDADLVQGGRAGRLDRPHRRRALRARAGRRVRPSLRRPGPRHPRRRAPPRTTSS